jgi:hypothetical protein
MVRILWEAVLIDNRWATYTAGNDTDTAFRGRQTYGHGVLS